ncbi:MAG: GGDEF domain-containing protein [Candidatus Sabulitectum sp.]|nr:GGDEF domain-containing protein [Candidatus Sabulitectum sp.]
MKTVSFPRMVELDTVTGLPPRKILDHDLPVLLRSMGMAGLPMCSIMIDIDHFKKFNDKHGHDTGDMVLYHVSSLIRKAVRFRGEAYRYGGEEITVLMLNTNGAEGLATAERICSVVENSEVTAAVDGINQPLSVRISLGVASTDTVAGSELLVSSDRALYNAKSSGRNQAILFRSDRRQAVTTTIIDVHFPSRSAITGGNYILLKKWFSRSDPTDIEAREIKDPNTDSSEFAEGHMPPYGLVEAEIRGRVSEIERRGNHTHFKFEVKSYIIDLMFKYIQDTRNAYN